MNGPYYRAAESGSVNIPTVGDLEEWANDSTITKIIYVLAEGYTASFLNIQPLVVMVQNPWSWW